MSLKIVILAIVCVIFVSSQAIDDTDFPHFQGFMQKFAVKYTTPKETQTRFTIYKRNMINSKNIFNLSTVSPTKFMDLSPAEFHQKYLTLDIKNLNTHTPNLESFANVMGKGRVPPPVNPTATPTPTPTPTPSPTPTPTLTGSVPLSFDWRSYGAVGTIKDQGTCGDCWAFSTIGNLEGLYYNKYKTMKSFSEQQLLDCDTGNSGCNGGMMDRAYTYLQGAGGSVLESAYPYVGVQQSCRVNTSAAVAKLSGWRSAGSTDENVIKQMLYTIGPISAVLNASPLQYYTSGVLDLSSASCSVSGVNHAVLLVGYGTLNGLDYWIVKNSWGPRWGESGFFRISRGKGTCGINSHVVSAQLA